MHHHSLTPKGCVPFVQNDDDDDVYFYSAISTKKPIALYSIN